MANRTSQQKRAPFVRELDAARKEGRKPRCVACNEELELVGYGRHPWTYAWDGDAFQGERDLDGFEPPDPSSLTCRFCGATFSELVRIGLLG